MARHDQVDAAVDGFDLDRRQRFRLTRKRRELGRQREGRVAAPHSHQADQRLALAACREPGLTQTRAQLCVKGGKLGLVELIAAARFAEPRVQPHRRVHGGARLIEEADLLLGGDGADVRPPRVRGQAQCGRDSLLPSTGKLISGDRGAALQGDQAQDVADQPRLEIGHAGADDTHQGNARIGRQAGLDIGRLRNSEIVVRRLQVAVVEQRHLHRRVGRQRLGQQACDLLLCPLRLLGARDLDHALADAGTGLAADALRHLAHAAVGRKRGAAGQQAGQREHDRPGPAHGVFPSP